MKNYGRTALICLLAVLTSTLAWGQASFNPGTPLDNFNRANQGPPPSAQWAFPVLPTDPNGLSVISNQLDTALTGASSAYWIGPGGTQTFGPDVRMSLAVPDATPAGANLILNLYVRLINPGTSTVSGYECRFRPDDLSNDVLIRRLTNAVGTTLATFPVDIDDGETVACSAIGNQICAYECIGGTCTSVGCATDTTYTAAGRVGVLTSTSAMAFDDFWAATVGGAPYAMSSSITGITFDWTTHDRQAVGSDNFPITWSDDGHQYTSFGDGGGFGGTNTNGRVSLGFARIEGATSASYTGHNVWGGLSPENPAQFEGKSYGIISIGGVLYAWVSPGSTTQNYTEAQLCKSTNKSATWTCNNWTLLNQTDQLILPTILNFGQDYAGARDTFVYSYVIDMQVSPGAALQIQAPGIVYLMRVPIASIETEAAYEFFSGMSGSTPTWGNKASRQPVFQDANGVGWNLSVSYNAPLQRYFLITEHTASFQGRIGIFDAPEPWGPWTTVLYDEGFGAGQIEQSVFFWNFANKWLSADGKSFTMVFSGINENDSWNLVRGTLAAVEPPGTVRRPSAAIFFQ